MAVISAPDEREILLYNTLANMYLLERAPRMEIMRNLLGLQAQFSRNPEYSLRLRATDYTKDGWSEGIVKIWSHRSTMHMVDEDEIGLYLSARGYGIDTPYGENWWGLSPSECEEWEPVLLSEIRAGNDTRDGLKDKCGEMGMSEELSKKVFYGWGGLIKEMTLRGKLACACGTDKRYVIPKSPEFMPVEAAREELVRRYFTHLGPATVRDCAYFFQYPNDELKQILAKVLPDLIKTRVLNRDYYHMKPLITTEKPPECILTPGFDQTVLAYSDRSRFVAPENRKNVTNIAGIVFPLAIVRGYARAAWKLDGEKATVKPFERLYKKDEAAIKRAFKKNMGVKDVTFNALPEIEL